MNFPSARIRRLMISAIAVGVTCATSVSVAQQAAPGLGPAGALSAVQLEAHGQPLLWGRDARYQLVVTGKYSSGQLHDLTRKVKYTASKQGIVSITAAGFVSPLANGEVTITATAPDGKTATQTFTVEKFDSDVPVNFPNQVVPILTKLGCNTGGCHGKSDGQNGFKLSLLGFYPKDDYEFLVKEGRGRRLFPSSPEFSLLLLKPTNVLAHGGGRRLEMDSYEGQVLKRWIEQGMPYGNDDDPLVERLEVTPPTRNMNRGTDQQVAVVAHYTDGSARDVTRIVQYETNNFEIAEVTRSGLVKTLDTPGETAVMVRFQGHVAVFRPSVPLGVKFASPAPRNYVDTHVFGKLTTLGIPPSARCTDEAFIRRATIDIAGRLPQADEARAFVADKSAAKRDALIERLLESPGYGDYFANKWTAVLRNRTDRRFHGWVRRAIQKNMPYDQFVRNVLAASGDKETHPPSAWYDSVTTTVAQAEDTAQLFLGMRIQCARCHHHPYERWTQNDYYGFSAFFSRVGRKPGRGRLANNQPTQRLTHLVGLAQSRNPRTQKDVLPTGLGGEALEIPTYEDPRLHLVNWMTRPDNPYFARALVNRYWKHFLGRGIVDPEDDMRVTNPPTNPQLLDALARQFIANKFDLKKLVRDICRSNAYQLSSEPNEHNTSDKQNFSSYYPKRLNAEVLYDAINQVTNTTTTFSGLPKGMKAVELPDHGVNNYFLSVFGKPQAASACECERSADANLAQSLHLLNSPEVQGKLIEANGRAALLAKEEDRVDREKVVELYLWVFARNPTEKELAIVLPHVAKTTDKKQAFEDVVWALINTKEFLFNH